MFRIGEFSQITKVTIDTLRHYDALGLLKPAKVDPFTGYRYYSARQLVTLNRILALKEVGFSLDEIARILQQKLTSDELRGMLKAQLLRAEQELHAAHSRQERILTRLQSLELEEEMPAYEVTLKPVERHTIAAIREVVPVIRQMPERCSQMFDTIEKWLRDHRLPIGPSLTIYYNEGFTDENIDHFILIGNPVLAGSHAMPRWIDMDSLPSCSLPKIRLYFMSCQARIQDPTGQN